MFGNTTIRTQKWIDTGEIFVSRDDLVKWLLKGAAGNLLPEQKVVVEVIVEQLEKYE